MTRIALDHGFSDYRTLWEHPDNAALKARRKNPNVLFPGDVMAIPERVEKQEPRPTDQRHRFRVRRPSLALRLQLEDIYHRPIANATCELVIENDLYQVTTDPTGRLEREIPPRAERAWLTIRNAETPLRDVPLELRIGHLHPVDTVSGQLARLANLGYYDGDSAAPPVERRFRLAIEEFQCEHSLRVDGVCGLLTQDKLQTAHGC